MIDFALHFVMVVNGVRTLRAKIGWDFGMDGGRQDFLLGVAVRMY